jgi:hypothetical protein
MSIELNGLLEPGQLVRHPDAPEWGLGQVQSNIGSRITVNFEEVGKVVIDGSKIMLQPVYEV